MKKTKIRNLSCIVALFLALGLCLVKPLPARAEEYTDTNDIKYFLDTSKNTAAVTDYTGSGGSVTIPSKITKDGVEYSVVEIQFSAFNGRSELVSITIPDSVKTIGDYAFWQCLSLTEVVFSQNSDLTSIGREAFYECKALDSITIPKGVETIGDLAFSQCSNLTEVVFSQNSDLTSIGESAFYRCKALGSITIPNGVTSIGREAFYGCEALGSITIPDGVTTIAESAFSGCTSLANVGFGTSSQLTSIGKNAFHGCRVLESITIPDSVTTIGKGVFGVCHNLKTINYGGTQSAWETLISGIDIGIPSNCQITYAKVELSFDNNGYGTQPTPVIITTNTKPSEVTGVGDNGPVLTENGYTFGGWYEDKDCTDGQEFRFTDPLPADATVYAKWTPHTYTVEFVNNGGSGSMTSLNCTYDEDKVLTTNGFTRTGYTFAGWATDANGSVLYADGATVRNLTAEPNGKVTLFAQWTPNNYTVSFDGNGATGGAMADQSRKYDDREKLTKNTFTNGTFAFTGWNTAADGLGDAFADEDAANITAQDGATVRLYAQWDKAQITTNSLPDGTVGTAYSQTVKTEYMTAPVKWTVSSGTLPDGLSLDGDKGTLSGTPEKAGDFTFTLQAKDSAKPVPNVLTKDFTLQVNEAPHVHSYGNPAWKWGSDFKSAEAVFTCTGCSTYTATVNAGITENTTEATTEAAGKTVYTATVSFEGKTYTDTREKTIAKLKSDSSDTGVSTQKPEPLPEPEPGVKSGWENGSAENSEYWYENGVRLGTVDDPKTVSAGGISRGREVQDPKTGNWYWLDANADGKKATNKWVMVPYFHQELTTETAAHGETFGDTETPANDGTFGNAGAIFGKWVYYDETGQMLKGWQHDVPTGDNPETGETATYYFDPATGATARGICAIEVDGVQTLHRFDPVTGVWLGEVDPAELEDDGACLWEYWYEDGVLQGVQGKPWTAGDVYRGKEIYDPLTDAWYWLDECNGGRKAVGKDVYQPYHFSDEVPGSTAGKWVRYDKDGHMVKGWQRGFTNNQGQTGDWYFDPVTGAMYKGTHEIDGVWYTFDEVTGILLE